jgi:RecA-family ATPase
MEDSSVSNRIKIFRGSEIQSDSPSSRWLIHSLLPASSCVFLLAEPKVGKSFTALEMALSVISGNECFQQNQVMQTGPVAIYCAEDAPWIIGERLKGIARAKGCSKIDLENLHIVDRSNGIFLDEDESFTRLRSALIAIGPKLVILDPLAQILCKTQESNARQMADVLRKVRNLQTELDCTILITHHVRKDGKGSINARTRGSSMIASFWDGCLLMEKSFNGIVRIESSWKGFPTSPETFIRLQSHNGGYAPIGIGIVEKVS